MAGLHLAACVFLLLIQLNLISHGIIVSINPLSPGRWGCDSISVIVELTWWIDNLSSFTGSGNDLVPLGNKPFPESVMIKISHAGSNQSNQCWPNSLTLQVMKWEYSDNWTDTHAADALAPYVARSSAIMVLTIGNY